MTYPRAKLREMNPLPPPSRVFETYWCFAAERHRVYEQRLRGLPAPWTSDPVLAAYRFTNVFRAADRVSQFLIREVIYRGDQAVDEVVFRILLFKLFNKIETWQLLSSELGELSLSTFDVEAADRVLGDARARGTRIYSNAYIVPPIAGSNGIKHRGHLRLIATMIDEALPARISRASNLEEVYLLLRSYPGIGNFLAYQFAVDINYSDVVDHDEDEFVMAGPGALDGISKVFPGSDLRDAGQIVRRMTDEQESWFNHYGLSFGGLFGRRLHLIDIQNLFCEISKYARVAHPEVEGVSGRTRIKQSFRAAGPVPTPYFPPKWGVEIAVERSEERALRLTFA
jgi:alpha-glutamyl/putrescinyl thymine pyrophosphorylase clade 1